MGPVSSVGSLPLRIVRSLARRARRHPTTHGIAIHPGARDFDSKLNLLMQERGKGAYIYLYILSIPLSRLPDTRNPSDYRSLTEHLKKPRYRNLCNL